MAARLGQFLNGSVNRIKNGLIAFDRTWIIARARRKRERIFGKMFISVEDVGGGGGFIYSVSE